MNSTKSQWLAAISYLLILPVIVNVHFLGLSDFFFFGIDISMISIAPYLIYVTFLFRSEDSFIKIHVHTSISIFFVYFVLTSLFGFVMYILGYHLNVIDFSILKNANSTTWLAFGPLLAILLYTTIGTVQGIVASFRLRCPGGDPEDVNSASE
jgi:hypothetical protein